MVDITPLQLGIPGGPELLIVLVVLILLFGANKIPKLARSTGQAMGEFKRGREEIEEELKEMEESGTAETTTETATSETATSETTTSETTTESESETEREESS